MNRSIVICNLCDAQVLQTFPFESYRVLLISIERPNLSSRTILRQQGFLYLRELAGQDELWVCECVCARSRTHSHAHTLYFSHSLTHTCMHACMHTQIHETMPGLAAVCCVATCVLKRVLIHDYGFLRWRDDDVDNNDARVVISDTMHTKLSPLRESGHFLSAKRCPWGERL